MLRAGHMLQLLVISMLGFAIIMVHSADMHQTQASFDLFDALKTKHMAYACIAVFVMWISSKLNLRHAMEVRWYFNPVVLLWVISLLLVGLAMIPGVGLEINGARRWLRIGSGSSSINFQPSELTKWATVLLIAYWCTCQHGKMKQFFKGLTPALLLVGGACLVVVLQDFGTAALIAVVAAIVLVAGGARLWQFMMFIPVVAGAVVLAVMAKPHRFERLKTFLNPWEDAQGAGYQINQSFVAFGEGGLTGSGLGNGIQKHGYLPTGTSDFLFANICEELGIAGALFVIAMYVAMMWIGLDIVKGCKDKFTRLIGLGIMATLGIQAMINLAVVTGLVPTKGIALPLLSAGGTGWIVTAFAMGLVASLDQANALEGLDIDDLDEVESELEVEGEVEVEVEVEVDTGGDPLIGQQVPA
jgi:cell division protein FtsW